MKPNLDEDPREGKLVLRAKNRLQAGKETNRGRNWALRSEGERLRSGTWRMENRIAVNWRDWRSLWFVFIKQCADFHCPPASSTYLWNLQIKLCPIKLSIKLPIKLQQSISTVFALWMQVGRSGSKSSGLVTTATAIPSWHGMKLPLF